MPRPRPASQRAPWPVLLVLAVLIVGVYFTLTWLQRQQDAGVPLEQTADLISDDRLIFGGAPRPAPGAGDEVRFTVLKNRGYIVGYSDSRRDPLWVCYRAFHVAQPFDFPRPGSFSTDPRTVARVKDADFARSGYQRGHMAPNADIMREFGQEAQRETFLLSNICPQAPELNEHVWERLEADERKYADTMEEVWVIDGPIFGDLNGGTTARLASGIAVPQAFFKILIDEEGHPGGKPRIFSVIMPQDVKGTELPQQFLTTVSEIQKETHLDFLWKLDAQAQAELEGTKWKMW
jgi:endonuclease G, mitochondrial